MTPDPIVGELAAGLRAHLLRLGRRGRTRLALPRETARGVPPVPVPAAEAPRAAADPRATPARGAREAARPRADAPAPAPAAAGELRPTPPPAPRPLAADPAAVAEIRARAAACADLEALRAEVARCTACALSRTRTQTVFADGAGRVPVLFVGEAPGAEEDAQGVPFVGRAGRLLTDIITKGMGLAREDVSIANVLKCRPPENRDPTAEEKALCTGWLDRQIELLDPKVVIPLGRHAAGHVLGSEAPMGRLRGRVHAVGGRKVVPTYHPAFLLRSPEMKRPCWEDIQLAMGELGLSAPGRRASEPEAGSP